MLLALLALPAAAHGESSLPDRKAFRAGQPIVMMSSPSLQGPLQRLVKGFAASRASESIQLEASSTEAAVSALIFGTTLLAATDRAVDRIELVPYRKINQTTPLSIRFAEASAQHRPGAASAVGFYVNASNPLARLSTRQVAGIFTQGHPDGDMSQWGQVGLGGAWALRPIRLLGVVDEQDLAAQLRIQHFAGRSFATSFVSLQTTGEVVRELAEDPMAIAFASTGISDPRVRQLPIVASGATEAALPSGETLRDGRYPYGRHLYLHLRRTIGVAVDPLALEFARYVLSSKGQALIAAGDEGYVTLEAATLRAEMEKLK